MRRLLACSPILIALVMLAACKREEPAAQAPAQPGQEQPGTAATPPPAPAELKDVIERDPRYVIGISYPKGIDKYPGLAAELRQYSDAARNELKQALDGLGTEKPSAPYDLTLSFNTVLETPQIVAVSADGSSYTGGAHGNPLVARFVWLPQQNKALKINELIVDKNGWRDLSGYVREQLHAALSQRIDADEMPPAERAELMKSALKMIDEGSMPEADNFAQFEPVLASDNKLSALRFVFPPYQVGPYSDGVQTVEVPASVLLPHVAQEYRDLFASTPAPSPAAPKPAPAPAG
ncbi:DUF3298 and DUF4163 domain-containing protein [Luteimonas panaciterrae]|uniref:DUF3298 and DUF4163 domain-containing protein n=1 Tax=Luteimonas panaciterrae TaxID=363885 RepID=UPI001CFB01AA|nr:DUF3298 and DUF4163 domain-containing protein [Luteimonas panaciterrae]